MKNISDRDVMRPSLENSISSLRKTKESVYDDLIAGRSKIAVVGLGYVGLPLALEFARDMNVIGFDINEDRVESMRSGVDPSCELDSREFSDKKIVFTSEEDQLKAARVYIVAVPTPVDERNAPNLKALKSATAMVAKRMDIGDYVIFESTVYPGCTDEVCIPILEKFSGLRVNSEFKVGYSPERINPGDQVNTLTKVTKVVSGSDEWAAKEVSRIYGHIIDAGIHEAQCIRVAEAAKIVENVQRDVNIALMNELSVLFYKMGIDTKEVLEAAGTKWNFLKFHPGLVGGHCIGVDPYYLIHKARNLKVDVDVLKSCRMINDWMPFEVVHRLYDELKTRGQVLEGARVLVKGITFKENVTDIRNSKAAEIVNILKMKNAEVEVTDPHADPDEVKAEYDIDLAKSEGADYDVVIIAVSHDEYRKLNTDELKKYFTKDPLVFDVKGVVKNTGSVRLMRL